MKSPLAQAARKWPQAPALVDGDQVWTWRDLEQAVARRAAELDLAPGACRVLTPGLSGAAIIELWATWLHGGVACPRRGREDPAHDQLLARYVPEPGDATVVVTSGSSGAPSAVVHTVAQHLAAANAANSVLPLQPGDAWGLCLPLVHVGGLAILWRCALAGAAVVIGPPWPRPISHLSLVPTQLWRLLRAPPSTRQKLRRSLRGILVGGAATPPALVQQAWDAGLPVLPTYGCSEIASQACTTRLAAIGNDGASVGHPLPHCEVHIADTDEILLHGASLARLRLTASGPRPLTDDTGWYHTGDRGTWTADGRLCVQGRLDRMFISGGENVQPEVIERALATIPAIQRAAVVSVADPEFGARPVAFVATTQAFDVESWRRALLETLPKFMLPIRFHPWPDDMPWKPRYAELERRAAVPQRAVREIR